MNLDTKVNLLLIRCSYGWTATIIVTIFLIVLIYPSPARSAEKPIDFFVETLKGRAILWPLGTSTFAIAQPYSLLIAGTMDGNFQIGFTHSGYTKVSKPKEANLFISLDVSEKNLSSEEMQTITAQGAIFIPKLRPKATSFTLDLILPADPGEETRLRALAKLPRVFPAGTIQLIGLHWVDIKGRLLYDWLTNANGLRFVLTATGISSLPAEASFILDSTQLDRWWDRRVGAQSDRLSWLGGEVVLAYELLASEVVVSIPATAPLNRSGSYMQAARGLSVAIRQKSQSGVDNKLTIGLQDLKNIGTIFVERLDLEAAFPVRSELNPGQLLRNNPSYVIDQSNAAMGLDALLKDQ